MTKVLVTGAGAVSAIGTTVRENMESLRKGKHGIGPVMHFRTSLGYPAGEVKMDNASLKSALGISMGRTVSRTALLGLMAAYEALRDSGADASDMKTGLVSATSAGGMDLTEVFYPEFMQDSRRGRLRDVVMHDCGASTEFIADTLGIRGFVTTVSTACSSAGNAVMLGARLIRHGLLDTVIVGGTDALCRFTLNGFNSLMILDRQHCRPMDASRNGLNLGEGAGYIVLQSEKAAVKAPYCELTGFSNVNEAFHQTGSSPDGDGAFMSMSEAIAQAGISPGEVSYINVHGTGTGQNDLSESMAIRRLFGDRIPMFSSVKPFIGHTLGASEGIEAVYSVMSVAEGTVYPNLNFSTPLPETGLVPVLSWQTGLEIDHVVSNSFGFGGNNSSLVFSRCR